MQDAIIKHCKELDRCNQRGGRMLSIFDLLEAQTLDVELAAYLMARISRGASLMVGAVPGGAGKTTVMCALLNLLPAELPLVAATPQAVQKAAEGKGPQPSCYICHEISSGPYFAYLWGRQLQTYCALTKWGHILATNLHADDLNEAREQVCSDNDVPVEQFNTFNLLIFISAGSRFFNSRRRIERVYTNDGSSGHILIFDAQGGIRPEAVQKGYLVDSAYVSACRSFLEETLSSDIRTIRQTRKRVVQFLANRPF